MTIWRNVSKIKRQIFGEENIFGYETTIVNQLHLMCNIYGKIFKMDENVNWFIKVVYLIWHYSALVSAFMSGLLFLQYGNKRDFIMFLHVGFAVCQCTFLCALLPLASYRYMSDIEAMLAHMDNVLSKRKRFVSHFNMKDILTNDMLVIITLGLMYNLVCCFDVVFFYEEEKITNYMYYPYPLPCLETYGSFRLYVMHTAGVYVAVILPVFELWTILKFLEIWAAVCYQEVVFICEDLKRQSENVTNSNDFNITGYHCVEMLIPEVRTYNMKFNQSLRMSIKAFQDVSRLINILLKYYQSISSLTVMASFICQLAHAYICLATDLALSVKCREFALFSLTAVLTFIVCRVGEILENLTDVMTFGVYGAPWYLLSPPFRKDVVTMISQAQKGVNPKIIKVYPIDVNVFGRLMNGIFSTTNVLARLMRK